jgi:hypothetical protein
MLASVTFHVTGSIAMTQTPFPVPSRRFASWGYSGSGALIAIDWATESDINTGTGMLAFAKEDRDL